MLLGNLFKTMEGVNYAMTSFVSKDLNKIKEHLKKETVKRFAEDYDIGDWKEDNLINMGLMLCEEEGCVERVLLARKENSSQTIEVILEIIEVEEI